MARRQRNKQPRQLKDKYLVIVDGDTEKWYLDAMKKHMKLTKFHFKPEIGKISETQIEEVLANLEVYSKIFWIIDFDVVLKEERERKASKKKKTGKTKLQLIKEYYDKYKNLIILVNNPCLEVWFLMHFQFTTSQFSNCTEVENLVKKYIPNYDKSEKFFIRQNPDIYQRLSDKINIAIENSAQLGNFEPNNTSKTLAEIYKLISFILNPETN